MTTVRPGAEVTGMSGPAALPRRNGELVFEAPWQGRAFGMALAVVERLGDQPALELRPRHTETLDDGERHAEDPALPRSLETPARRSAAEAPRGRSCR